LDIKVHEGIGYREARRLLQVLYQISLIKKAFIEHTSSSMRSRIGELIHSLDLSLCILKPPLSRISAKELEKKLNTKHGPVIRTMRTSANMYDRDCRKAGWPRQRSMATNTGGKLALPIPETQYFSITNVYMNSVEEYSGQYHAHPYGEINCVVPTAELMGMHGWQGDGWTCPGPGTHHYPQVRGGALVALFFLSAGRISYEATPDVEKSLTLDL
jgi:hypothetical protein